MKLMIKLFPIGETDIVRRGYQRSVLRWASVFILFLFAAIQVGCGGGGSGTSESSAPLQSIEVSPADGMITPGTSNQFTAMGTFADGSEARKGCVFPDDMQSL